MGKKHKDIEYHIKKTFSSTVTDKKGFEKEVDAINVNKRISMKLLLDNFKSFINFTAMGIVGVAGVYTALKSALGGKKDDNTDDGDNKNKPIEDDIKTNMDGLTSDLKKGVTSGDFQSDAEKSMSETAEKGKNFLTDYKTQSMSTITDTKTSVDTFIDDVKKGKAINNIDSNITSNKSSFEKDTASLGQTDLSSVSNKYVESASKAMTNVANHLDTKLIPKYQVYNGTLQSIIETLDKIFNIRAVEDDDIPTEQDNYNKWKTGPNKGQDTYVPTWVKNKPTTLPPGLVNNPVEGDH